MNKICNSLIPATAIFVEGFDKDLERITGGSSFSMVVDELGTKITMYFDATLMDATYAYVKLMSQGAKKVKIKTESGMDIRFTAKAVDFGKNFVVTEVVNTTN